MSSPINTLSSACLRHGEDLIEETESARYDSRTHEVSRHAWGIAVYKFETWMMKTRAVRDDHDPGSLTYQIQDREHVEQALISLLIYMRETLKAPERCVKRDQSQEEIEKVKEVMRNEREGETAEERSRRIYMEGYVDGRTELQCLCATVEAILQCLDSMALLAMPRERLVDKFFLSTC